MRKRFNKGDIVYWCQRRNWKYYVKWGMVDEQFPGVVYVDYLSPKENRLVNGIPIDKFKSETKYKKLPKGWSYDTKLYEITFEDVLTPIDEELKEKGINFSQKDFDARKPETIKKAYKYGYLVKDSEIFHGGIGTDITKQGYRVVKQYPIVPRHRSYVSIRPYRLYRTYEEAKKEVDDNTNELKRQASLTDLEWSIEQIDKDLNRWANTYNIDDNKKAEYRDWIMQLDNLEEVETRVYASDIQWKYEKHKRWSDIEL